MRGDYFLRVSDGSIVPCFFIGVFTVQKSFRKLVSILSQFSIFFSDIINFFKMEEF